MFLQLGAAQVRGQIDIRRLDRLSPDQAHGICNLMVEESSNTLIMGYIATRALLVPEPNGSSADRTPVVAAQCRNMKRVNQVSKRCVCSLEKLMTSFSNNF